MELNKKALLFEQANKIENVINLKRIIYGH